MTFNYEEDLTQIYKNVNLAIKYLRDPGLFRKFVYCSFCNNKLKGIKYKKKKKQRWHGF